MCDRRASDNRRWFRRRFWVQPGLISNMLKLSYPILQNFFKSAPALLFYRMLQSLPITFCSYPQAMSCHGEAFQKYPWCNRSSSSSSSTALGLVRFERRSPVFLVSFFLFLISFCSLLLLSVLWFLRGTGCAAFAPTVAQICRPSGIPFSLHRIRSEFGLMVWYQKKLDRFASRWADTANDQKWKMFPPVLLGKGFPF